MRAQAVHYLFRFHAGLLSVVLGVILAPFPGPAGAQEGAELRHYRRVLSTRPRDVQAHKDYQDAWLKVDGRSGALEEYGVYLASSPGDSLYLYLYSRLLIDPVQARSYLKRAVAASSNFYHAHLDLGRSTYYAGDYPDAVSHYRMALKVRPRSSFAHSLLGLAYYHQGYVNQAIAVYRRAIQLNEKAMDAYLNLGTAYYYTGKVDDAIAVYQKALKLNRDHSDLPTIHRNLGMAYAQKGRMDRAEAAYRKALELDPKFADVHVSLGNLAFNRGEYQAAAEAYEKAIGGRPDDGALHLKLGLAHCNRKSFQEGIQHLKRAVEIDSTSTDTYYYLGWAYYRDKQNDLARDLLETYIAKEQRAAKRSTVIYAKDLIDDIKRQGYQTF